MNKTGIEYLNYVWNVATGCSPASEGCRNCYAARYAKRGIGDFKAQLKGLQGVPLAYVNRPFSEVRCHEDRLDWPLKLCKPARIGVCFMGDLFHDAVPEKFIAEVFAAMALCPQHTFPVLTKRRARMMKLASGKLWVADGFSEATAVGHLPNVWLGVSVENQAAADERIPLLLKTPAAVRWASYEPALGPVDFRRWLDGTNPHWSGRADDDPSRPKLDWIVLGGESGPKARPMHPNWARGVRNQCQEAGVPFYFKQVGEWFWRGEVKPTHILFENGECLPHGQAIQHKPGRTEPYAICRVGKKAAGRMLDGKEWLQMPEAGER